MNINNRKKRVRINSVQNGKIIQGSKRFREDKSILFLSNLWKSTHVTFSMQMSQFLKSMSNVFLTGICMSATSHIGKVEPSLKVEFTMEVLYYSE